MRRGSKYSSQLTKGSQSVVSLIESNPLLRSEDIAKALGITEMAARKRIRRLIKDEVLIELFAVNQDYSSFPAQVLVFVKIASGRLRRNKQPGYSGIREFVRFVKVSLPKTRDWINFFKSKPGEAVLIDEVYSVSGGGMGTDVVMLISGTAESLLREFVIEVISTMNGVDETNTAAITHVGS